MASGAGVFGPFRHGNKWRIFTRAACGSQPVYLSFPTESEAEEAKKLMKAEIERKNRKARTIEDCINEYRGFCLTDKGLKLETVDSAEAKIKRLLEGELDREIGTLTPAHAATLYRDLATRISPATGKPYSAATHRITLITAGTFGKWLAEKKYLRANPFEGIKPIGKMKRGKDQLRIDDSRKWYAEALRMAETDNGAVAAIMALTMGMRASEIVNRKVRDLDNNGSILIIGEAKTRRGVRSLVIPEILRPMLARAAQGKGPDDLLLGFGNRQVVRQWTHKICEAAGVPLVCAHALRGMHSTLALEAGATAPLVAATLGHDVNMTIGTYSAPGAAESGRTGRVLDVLATPAPTAP